MLFDWMQYPDAWTALLTLTAMEIILGIDNIVFITILCGRLPREKQVGARRIGLAVAMLSRMVLLAAISWVMRLTTPLFTDPIMTHAWSGKDLILLFGGIFLVGKATHEIYENVERPDHQGPEAELPGDQSQVKSYSGIIFQILLLDIVFSLDSVITAVGMTEYVPVMFIAVIISVGVMLVFARAVGDFIQDNPSVRILALAFLMLIGTMLVAESTGEHVSKGYIYSAMGFSLLVEMINLRMRRNVQKVVAPPKEPAI